MNVCVLLSVDCCLQEHCSQLSSRCGFRTGEPSGERMRGLWRGRMVNRDLQTQVCCWRRWKRWR